MDLNHILVIYQNHTFQVHVRPKYRSEYLDDDKV
jgi:hypothetical protein